MQKNNQISVKDSIWCDRLLAHCESIENIATATEANLPSRWHFIERSFYKGRICCLREEALNIRDILKNI